LEDSKIYEKMIKYRDCFRKYGLKLHPFLTSLFLEINWFQYKKS